MFNLMNAPGNEPRGLLVLRLFGIPVYVEPAFLILIAIVFYVYSRGSGGIDFARVGLICFIIFFSLLVHEFGHASVARALGCDGIRIAVAGLGGYATHTPTTRGKSLLISLAGPAFGYVAGLIALLLYNFRYELWALFPGSLGELAAPHFPAASDLFWITASLNIFWSTFNLLPIYPMDGGQSVFHILTYKLRDNLALLYVSRLSMFLCVPLAILAFQQRELHFAAIILALLFLENLRTSQALS